MFQSSWPSKQNGTIDNSISVMGHHVINSIMWPNESQHILFQVSSPNEDNDATDDAVGITQQ